MWEGQSGKQRWGWWRVDDLRVSVGRSHRQDSHAEAVECGSVNEKLRTGCEKQGDAVAVAVTRRGIGTGSGKGLGQHPLVGKLSSFRTVVALRSGWDTQKRGIGTSCSG